jgi:hypothetical protein
MNNSLHVKRYYDIIESTKSHQERYFLLCRSIQQNEWKPSSTRGLSLGVILSRLTGRIVTTTGQTPYTSTQALRRFTLKYGKILTGLYLMAVTFTIETVTRLIMLLITWNALQKTSILPIMVRFLPMNEDNRCENTWKRYGILHQSGISQKLVGHGIAKWDTWLGIKLSMLLAHVNTVVQSFRLQTWELPNVSALTTARQVQGVNQASIMSSVHALIAVNHSQPTSTAPSNIALVPALRECEDNIDPARYLVARFDLRPLSVGYSSRIY